MTFDKEFKEAISHLASEEKDKLILRLLKKDLNLANRLYFELVDSKDVDERRLDLEKRIKKRVEDFSQYYSSPGYLMMDMRDISGEITAHVKITKDKFGEVSLNLAMLNEVLRLQNSRIIEATPGKARKLCTYIIARAFKILVLSNKLHEDLMLDINDEIEKLGQLISENDYLMKTAIKNGFDVNWLIKLDIPENIEEIHKDIKRQGYLTGRTYLRIPNYTKKTDTY
jgi:hypothetical protein